MILFHELNTNGYTQDQLDDINAEWTLRAAEKNLEEYTHEYYAEAEVFANEVAQRCTIVSSQEPRC